jgi:opacity protein-like surface antigen
VSVLDSNNIGLPQPPSNTPVNGETKWVNGWTAGGGMEFALTNQWSAKAEYMYYDLGSTNYSVDGPTLVEVDTRGSTLRVGVNYHFHSVQETAPLK